MELMTNDEFEYAVHRMGELIVDNQKSGVPQATALNNYFWFFLQADREQKALKKCQ